MSEHNKNSSGLLARFIGGVTGFVARRPRLVLWPVLLIACAAVGITVSDLKLHTSRSELMDPAAGFSESWTQYTETFGSDGDLVVVVETPTPNSPLIESVLNNVGERLQREPEYFKDVLYRINQREFRRKGLQFLSPGELRVASRRVESFSPVVRDGQWDRIRLESLIRALSQKLTAARQNGESEVGLLKHADRFAVSLDRFLDQSLSDFRYDASSFQSPWQPIVSVDVEPSVEDADLAYMINPEKTRGMIQAVAVAQEKDLDPRAASITRLREICDEVTASLDESGNTFSLAVTGIPVLEHDELRKAGTDMLFAALIALVAVGTLLAFGFRSIRHPMLILLTLVVALSCTFGVATLAVGHLNILSVCFAAILIGLGVDFGVHFLSRYLHQRQELIDVADSLAHTGRVSGTGISDIGVDNGSGIRQCGADRLSGHRRTWHHRRQRHPDLCGLHVPVSAGPDCNF